MITYANPNLTVYGVNPNYLNGTDQLIRTNILDLDASGSIGSHTDPNTARIPVNVELIESDYTDCGRKTDGTPIEDCTPPNVGSDLHRRLPHGTYTPGQPVFTRYIVITADAGDDIVLDVQSFRHADVVRAAADPFVITFGPINAGDDIDIFVLASQDRTNPGPALTTHVHRAKHNPDFAPDQYNRFFRPDCALPYHGSPCTVHELGNFATGSTPVTAHYLFASGYQDYDSSGAPSIGDRPNGVTPYLKAGDFISVRHLTTDHVTAGPVTFTGIVDADSDNNQVGSVILLTNGFINAEERNGAFRVDAIWSSDSDVTIWALGAIVDAETDAQTTPDPYTSITAATPTSGTDVRGVNISIYAGQAGGSIFGGVGTASNYLEIDVDVHGAGTGVLNAFDVTSGPNTPGIFLAETSNDLRLDTVWTTQNVSMYTIDGNIIDARNDHEVNVLGRTIALDANDYDGNAASIGTFGNDVEIDSRRGLASADVSLEADDSIYVTEADATASYDVDGDPGTAAVSAAEATPLSALRLVLARAWTGDIRLTVRDQGVVADEDDDLILLASGDFQRAEGDLLTIPNGTIIARLGSVLLEIGDDVDLHQNSRTLAGKSIDIYGDSEYAGTVAGALDSQDPNYGTDMILRGEIIAGCITPGDLSCAVYTGTPIWTTEIWGFTDVDSFQFGDDTGLPTLANPKETLGDDGYIYLGSKTRVYGDDTTDPTGNDGEDQFLVYYLQSTLVTTSPSTGTGSIATAGHSLTLDGLADTDTYNIWTTGSRRRSSQLPDQHPRHGGRERRRRRGVRPRLRLRRQRQRQPEQPAAQRRHLPAAPGHVHRHRDPGWPGSHGQRQRRLREPDRTRRRSARFRGVAARQRRRFPVQRSGRHRYWSEHLRAAGQLRLRSERSPDRARYGGNDHFYSDDTSVAITLDGGKGDDVFQIGQQFGTKRSAAGITVPDRLPTDGGGLLRRTRSPT